MKILVCGGAGFIGSTFIRNFLKNNTILYAILLGGLVYLKMNEGKKNSGISHLLEHVLTESWKKCKNDCAKYWGKKGIITNASTGDATINYYIEGLVKNSEEIIEYIVKITTDPQIRDSRITVEKKAVYEELSRELNRICFMRLNLSAT